MKFTYLLIAFLFLALNGCSDFTSEANEFELSGKMYACDESVQGDIANDTKAGKKLYCNGLRWIDLVSEDSIVKNDSNTQIMYECENGEVVKFKNLCSEQPSDYLPLDDTEYPYAGIPRIVIETENHRNIRDRETEIPAKLQIWGESAPESEIMELTIRGRGNTSWTEMPKKSYKIEFSEKQPILGMPKDRDWALIANYADKTLMKNFLMSNLSSKLGLIFTPRCQFAELFLNNEYQGVYTLSETIKVGKNRVNISHNPNSYLIEFDEKNRPGDNIFFSRILNSKGKTFKIHYPPYISKEETDDLSNSIQAFESFLKNKDVLDNDGLSFWIDEQEAIKHYWLQEFSRNPDANFYTSVFFVWTKNDVIKMGPIWDFDLAFGGHSNKPTNYTAGWQIRNYWYKYLFQDITFQQNANNFWITKKVFFEKVLNTIDSTYGILKRPAENNFKKWDILNDTTFVYHPKAFSSYEDAIAYLKKWIILRIEWIDGQIQASNSKKN